MRLLAKKSGSSKAKISSKKYNDPIPTVDVILRRDAAHKKEILIEKRGRPPFKGQYSLPGGHVDYGETVEEGALRELRDETSLEANLLGILGVYSDPKRDPRGQRISTVFIAECVHNDKPRAGDDAKSAEWVNLEEFLKETEIAFDHRLILEDYRRVIELDLGNTFWSSKKR
jgi:8-oxo-dGTP diphosphatase